MQFQRVCVAGTFDRIHKGHEALLSKAFAIGTHVIAGVTSDAFARLYKKVPVRSSHIRKRELADWLSVHGYQGAYEIIEIDDPYEPAVSDMLLEALVVSQESLPRGKMLNQKRKDHGMSPLALVSVSMVLADDALPISSTRVRKGQVDVSGKIIMPLAMRDTLSTPLGSVLSTDIEISQSFHRYRDVQHIISIGDQTTKTLLDYGIVPALMIIDNKVNRKVFMDLQPVLLQLHAPITHMVSGPGYISQQAIDFITQWFQKSAHFMYRAGNQCNLASHVLEIDGEEDLLALPVIACATLSSVVYYGQPSKGIVEVVVTKRKRVEAKKLLKQFVSS